MGDAQELDDDDFPTNLSCRRCCCTTVFVAKCLQRDYSSRLIVVLGSLSGG